MVLLLPGSEVLRDGGALAARFWLAGGVAGGALVGVLAGGALPRRDRRQRGGALRDQTVRRGVIEREEDEENGGEQGVDRGPRGDPRRLSATKLPSRVRAHRREDDAIAVPGLSGR